MFGMKKKLMKPDEKYQLKATVEDVVKLLKRENLSAGYLAIKEAEELFSILPECLYQNLDELVEGKELTNIEVYDGLSVMQIRKELFHNAPLIILCIEAIAKEIAGKEGFTELWAFCSYH